VIVTTVSAALTFLSAISALFMAYIPRSRSLKGLMAATVIPLSSLWAATLPVASTTMEIVQNIKFVDPMRPMLLNPGASPGAPCHCLL